MKKIEWKLQNMYLKNIYSKRRFAKPLAKDKLNIIFGTARSGTTWLAQTFTKSCNGFMIDEPLKRNDSKILKQLKLDLPFQCLGAEDMFLELQKYLSSILSGTGFNPNHFHAYHGIKQLTLDKRFVMKFINLSLIIDWFFTVFDTPPKTIYIIRNPYAVVSSMLNHFGKRLPDNMIFKINPQNRFPTYYNQYSDVLGQVKTKTGWLTAKWCLENLNVLNSPFHNQKWITFSYEDLVLNPEESFNRLNNYLPDALSIDIWKKQSRIPSYSSTNSNYETSVKRLTKWKNKLSSKQKNEVSEILKLFEIDFYHKNELLPDNRLFFH